MKKLIHILRMTIVGGVLFLAPFVLLIMILGKAHQLIQAVIIPLAERIPMASAIGLESPRVLAAVILLFMCFIAGLFSKTSPAKKLVRWLEAALLSNLPGYSFMKNLGKEVAGTTSTQGYEVVIVRFDDAWQIGFLVERIPGGRVVVYIPDAPRPWTGGVFIFDESRVEPIGASSAAAVRCLGKLGEGIGDMVKGSL
jgi:uncharacterized membrane protein